MCIKNFSLGCALCNEIIPSKSKHLAKKSLVCARTAFLLAGEPLVLAEKLFLTFISVNEIILPNQQEVSFMLCLS